MPTDFINGKYIHLYDGLLTTEECSAFIERFDGPGASDSLEFQDRGIAQYDRGLFVSQEWADRIYSRIRDVLPSAILPFICVNDHFRFSKYHDGGYFGLHQDGLSQNSRGFRTILTVNIFLNSEFDGGETDFYADDKTTLRVRAVPLAGRGAIFDREIYHMGNTVRRGYKYLIRTDVMFDSVTSGLHNWRDLLSVC
jgi:hypothetical protein